MADVATYNWSYKIYVTMLSSGRLSQTGNGIEGIISEFKPDLKTPNSRSNGSR